MNQNGSDKLKNENYKKKNWKKIRVWKWSKMQMKNSQKNDKMNENENENENEKWQKNN